MGVMNLTYSSQSTI